MSGGSDPYIFATDTLPADLRFLPPLANGLLGWKVFNNIMHMGGVYNGEGGRCHRADLPCPLAVKVEAGEPARHTYTLDTHKGSPRSQVAETLVAVMNHRCPASSSRHFYPLANYGKCDYLPVFLFTPILLQPDGDGSPDGASHGYRAASHCQDGQLIQTTEQRHRFPVLP